MKSNGRQSNYVPIYFGKKASDFSKDRGQWLLANVDQHIGWTQKKVLVIYRGRKVLLLPGTKSHYAAAAIITKDHTLKEGKTFLMQFLSALAWYQPAKLDIVQWTNSSTQGQLNKHLRMPLTKQGGMTRVFFRPTDLVDPKDPKGQLALAFFREGLSLNHPAYAFLSYYKIINLRYPKKEDKQKRWITRNLPLIENLNHLKALFKKLKSQNIDPTAYIYEACRCAVAHASMKATTYNPESVEDINRFYEILPIMHALAKRMIEDEFGIKSLFSIIGEHLYELEGFHPLFGKEISARLKARDTVGITEIQINTFLSLRLWNKKKFPAFERMRPKVIDIQKGIVTLSLSRDGIITIELKLDFPNEKLIFDPIKPIDLEDNGTKKAAAQFADALMFYSTLIGNGVIEIWETKQNLILGRLLEYIHSMRPGQPYPHKISEQLKAQAESWREEARKRN